MSGTGCGEDNASFKTDDNLKDGRAGADAINNMGTDTSVGMKKSAQDSQVSSKNGL